MNEEDNFHEDFQFLKSLKNSQCINNENKKVRSSKNLIENNIKVSLPARIKERIYNSFISRFISNL